SEPIWVQYPHARREMLKEILFLAPIFVGAAVGVLLFGSTTADSLPLWLEAFAGSLLGYLVGGGVVWAVRILGSLAFGKEAMGLGDVHLMGAVGAVLGWFDPTLAFFLAPVSGIAWAVASVVFSSVLKRAGTALPYGPHLAGATILVLFAHRAIDALF
ncbi:MAG: A24 family peptidase, partial [Planctomycetota bacterium]